MTTPFIRISVKELMARNNQPKPNITVRTALVTISRGGVSDLTELTDSFETKNNSLILATVFSKKSGSIETMRVEPGNGWTNKNGGCAKVTTVTAKGLELTYDVSITILEPTQ